MLVDDESTDNTVEMLNWLKTFFAVSLGPGLSHRIRPELKRPGTLEFGLARDEWLLFLDGDDTIAPTHLAQLLGVAVSRPHIGAVHSGWVRVRGGRKLFGEEPGPSVGDLSR